MIARRLFLQLCAGSLLPFPGLAAEGTEFLPPDREVMVPVTGGRVYVRINGDLNGPRPPLCCVHGGPGGSHAGFLNLLPLAQDRAVILFDQLDCGRSDNPNDPANWTVAAFTRELDFIARNLGIQKWHVLGHSWGGTVALEYAAQRPNILASTILVSPLVSTRSWLKDAARLRAALPRPTQRTLKACETRSPPAADICDAATEIFNHTYGRRNGRSPEIAAYVQSLPRPFNRTLYETMWGKTEFESSGSLKNYNGESLLAKLDGPRTLFMGGEFDEARPATLAHFARQVRGSRYAEIPGAGHGLFEDQPALALSAVREQLAKMEG